MGNGSENAGGPEGDPATGEFFRTPSPALPAKPRSQRGSTWEGPALEAVIALGTSGQGSSCTVPRSRAWRGGRAFLDRREARALRDQRAAAAGKAVAAGNLFDGWRRGRFGVNGGEIRSFRGSLRQDNLRVRDVSRLVRDRGPDSERIGRPRIPAFRTQQSAAANRHLPPFMRALGLVFQDQRFQVEMLILRFPPDRRHAAAPAIRLEHQRRGNRINHDLHARLDGLAHGW